MNDTSKRILVIDDEEAVRKSFLLALEDTVSLWQDSKAGLDTRRGSDGDRGAEVEGLPP